MYHIKSSNTLSEAAKANVQNEFLEQVNAIRSTSF